MERNVSKTVNIDMDGVLRDIVPSMCRLYNRVTGESVSPDNVDVYDVGVMFKKLNDFGFEPDKFFFAEHAYEVFAASPPFLGAKAALVLLHEHGYKVNVVTWQMNPANKLYALSWLEGFKIPYDGLFFTRDKFSIRADYMIDDNPDFLLDERDTSVKVRIEQPYNTWMNDITPHFPDIISAVKWILNQG